MDDRSCRVKLSFSSPGSCRNMQLLFVQFSLRRYAAQYLVVPYWALRNGHGQMTDHMASSIVGGGGGGDGVGGGGGGGGGAYLKVRPPFSDPSTATMHLAASSLRAKVTCTPRDWGLWLSFDLLTTILMILPYWPKYWEPRNVRRRSSSLICGFRPTTYTKFFCTTRRPAKCFRFKLSASFFWASFCRISAFLRACFCRSALNLARRCR